MRHEDLSTSAATIAAPAWLSHPALEIRDWQGLSPEAKARLKTSIVDSILQLANDDPVLAHALAYTINLYYPWFQGA